MTRSAVIGHLLPLAATLLVACSEDGDTSSGRGHLDANEDSGSGGTGGKGSVPEASPDSDDASSYPIDPNGPPPDCILPCVWEVMKRCPGPKPGQACVLDTLSRPYYVHCCPLSGPAPDGQVLCGDDSWVGGSSSAYKAGEPCWWREGKASMRAPGPPPRPADWTSTWYVRDQATGEPVRIAAVQHRTDVTLPGPPIGAGTCYDGETVVFTAYVDTTADHCQKWFPECEIPGICPLPPDWAVVSDAGPVDAATGGSDASMTPSDAASPSDAMVEASRSD